MESRNFGWWNRYPVNRLVIEEKKDEVKESKNRGIMVVRKSRK